MNTKVAAKTHTGTGDAAGYFDATDSTGFYPGAHAWLTKSDGTLQQLCLLTDLNGSGKIGIRFLQDTLSDPKLGASIKYPTYGRSDVSAYTAGSILSQDAQVVETQPAFIASP